MPTKEKEKPERAEKEDEGADEEKNVVRGDTHGKTIEQQTKEARGEGDEKEDKKKLEGKADGRDKEAEKILEEAFPERKAINLRVDARRDHAKALGFDVNRPERVFKVEKVDQGKQFVGMVTCESVHGETHERISARIELPTPRGEEYVWYAFKQHHPHAMREEFKIDADNKIDPNLRTRYE